MNSDSASYPLCDLTKLPLAPPLNAGHLPSFPPLFILRLFTKTHSVPFSYCSYSSWGSQGKNTEVACHSLLQWTTFCQTSPPRPGHLAWPHTAWLSFIELDKAVVHLSSGHRTGNGQFSFQSQRKAMPKNAQTTAQLHSSYTLVK